MSRALVIIRCEEDRLRICKWARNVEVGTRVEFKETKRSIPQNDRLHAMLGELSAQVLWHGIKLSVDDWKLLFIDGLKRELRIVPNLDGTGFVNLGRRTSELAKAEMTDLIELVFAFGANHGVTFKEERQAA